VNVSVAVPAVVAPAVFGHVENTKVLKFAAPLVIEDVLVPSRVAPLAEAVMMTLLFDVSC
jgi:hypothetical protein